MSDAIPETFVTDEVVANCLGLKVPRSQYLRENRIARINAAKYEGQEIAGALHVVRKDDVVLEIGAGMGVVGGVIALNSKPKAVHSFEANPAMIPVINKLYELNDLNDVIAVKNTILISNPDRPDVVEFHIQQNSFLGSSLIRPEEQPSKPVEIPTGSFNDTADEIGATVLVMDIEGGELELLRYADLDPFRAVVVEFHPGAYGVGGMRECKKILTDAGFEKVNEKSTRTVWTCVRPE